MAEVHASTSQCQSVDCGRTPPAAPPAARSYAGLDGAAHDYDSLLRLLLDQMARLAPDWSERSSADLAQVLLELAAYAGDQLSYLQDRVALEGYLRTATQHESVRRHLRLIDATLDPGYCAATEVVFTCTGTFPLFLPKGFAPSTAAPPGETAVVYETAHDAVLYPALSSVALSVDAPSSADGTQAVLAANLSGVLAADMWLWFEDSGAGEWAQVASVTFAATTTTVTLAAPLAQRYAVASATVQGNRVRATHGATTVQSESGTGQAQQRIALTLAPVVWVWDEASQSAHSTLSVQVDGELWTCSEDFLDAEAASQVYTVSSDNHGYLTVHFGDGVHGAAPALGSRIEVSYRVGDASAAPSVAGQVGANALTEFADRDFADPSQELLTVRNPMAARAPRPAMDLAQAKLLGPATLRTTQRAVVPEDFETLLAQGVRVDGGGGVGEQRITPLASRARMQHTGSWHTVVVSVDLPGRQPLAATAGLRAAFEAQLTAHKMAGLDVRVEDARYCALHIALRIDVAPEHFARDVRDAVEHALLTADDALLAAGRLSFGEPLYLSDLYAAVSAVPGVIAVAVTRFKRLGDRYPDSEAQGFIPVHDLEIARCDNDPAHPELGVLTVRTCGGRAG